MRASERQRRFVGLVAGGEELRQPRRAADHERQHAGRHRIERAGVADARDAQRAPRERDDVVRRRALRLVDDEDAIKGSGLLFQTLLIVEGCGRRPSPFDRSAVRRSILRCRRARDAFRLSTGACCAVGIPVLHQQLDRADVDDPVVQEVLSRPGMYRVMKRLSCHTELPQSGASAIVAVLPDELAAVCFSASASDTPSARWRDRAGRWLGVCASRPRDPSSRSLRRRYARIASSGPRCDDVRDRSR